MGYISNFNQNSTDLCSSFQVMGPLALSVPTRVAEIFANDEIPNRANAIDISLRSLGVSPYDVFNHVGNFPGSILATVCTVSLLGKENTSRIAILGLGIGSSVAANAIAEYPYADARYSKTVEDPVDFGYGVAISIMASAVILAARRKRKREADSN